MLQEFIWCPLTYNLLQFLSSSTPLPPHVTYLMVDFLRLLGDMLMSAHSKSLIERIGTPFVPLAKSPAFPDRRQLTGRSKRKKTVPSIFALIIAGIGTEHSGLGIAIELLILLADLLYLSVTLDVPLPQSDSSILLSHLDQQIKTVGHWDRELDPDEIPKCDRVQVWSEKLSNYYKLVLDGQSLNNADLFLLTSCFHPDDHFGGIGVSERRSSMGSIPCWNCQRTSSCDQSFNYCQQ